MYIKTHQSLFFNKTGRIDTRLELIECNYHVKTQSVQGEVSTIQNLGSTYQNKKKSSCKHGSLS